MNKICTLLLLLVPFIGMSKGKDDLSGHWREVKRLGTGGKKIAFRDTIFFEFKVGNEYTWQKKGGFIYRGSYKKENNTLDIGMRYFSIEQYKKGKRLVLKDQAGTYEFEPYTPVSGMVQARAQETYAPVASIEQMIGTWEKFKGTSKTTQQQIDYTTAVKKVEVFSRPEGNKLGNIYGARDGENSPSWYIESFSNQTIYCNGKSRRQFKVLKAQDNELIIEDDNFTYFLRRFR